MIVRSCLYYGTVKHVRFMPKRHRLSYRVFSVLIDLDELSQLNKISRWFAVDRAAALSFRQRDHGDGETAGLKDWVLMQLQTADIDRPQTSVRLLCYPRIFGYVFNPLSIYYCYDSDGDLYATLYEVNNTFGERHTYVIPVTESGTLAVSQSTSKRMAVSPFTGLDAHYRFSLTPPDDSLKVGISLFENGEQTLAATLGGRRAALTRTSLAQVLLRYPLMTLKVTLGIHLEALRIWRKGVPVVPRQAREAAVTVSHQSAQTSVRSAE